MKDVLEEKVPPGEVEAARAVEPERVSPKRVAAVIAALVLSALIMILNETVLTVALPNLMADLSIQATTAQWLTTGFMLTMAVVIPTTGFMLQRFTTKSLFVAAMLLFIVGTALATIAPTFAVLLIARIIQAGGTAIILPLLMTTTLTSVPVQHRGTVMGLNSVVISVAPAIGPTLSGAIIDSFNWRWVFGLMIPVAIIVFLFGAFAIKTGKETREAPLDVLSVILLRLRLRRHRLRTLFHCRPAEGAGRRSSPSLSASSRSCCSSTANVHCARPNRTCWICVRSRCTTSASPWSSS